MKIIKTGYLKRAASLGLITNQKANVDKPFGECEATQALQRDRSSGIGKGR